MGRVVLSVDGFIPQRQGREGGGCFFFLGERGGSVVSDWQVMCFALGSNKQTKGKKSATNVSVLKEKPLPNFVTLQHFQHFYKDLSCTQPFNNIIPAFSDQRLCLLNPNICFVLGF